jgi:hypothetical protein
MNTRRRGDFPADLAQVCRRFEESRRCRKARSRIPEPLWTAAVKMAGRHGINRTAKALRVDYYSLKKRIERKKAVGISPSAQDAAATFIELPPLISTDSVACAPVSYECTLEWKDAGGVKLRLCFPGIAATDLATFCRSLRP